MLSNQYTALTRWEEVSTTDGVQRTPYADGHVGAVYRYTDSYVTVSAEYVLTHDQFKTFVKNFNMTKYTPHYGPEGLVNARPATEYRSVPVPGSGCRHIVGYRVTYTMEYMRPNPTGAMPASGESRITFVVPTAAAGTWIGGAWTKNGHPISTPASGGTLQPGVYSIKDYRKFVMLTASVLSVTYPVDGAYTVNAKGNFTHAFGNSASSTNTYVYTVGGRVDLGTVPAAAKSGWLSKTEVHGDLHSLAAIDDFGVSNLLPGSEVIGWSPSPVLATTGALQLEGRFNPYETEKQVAARMASAGNHLLLIRRWNTDPITPATADMVRAVGATRIKITNVSHP